MMLLWDSSIKPPRLKPLKKVKGPQDPRMLKGPFDPIIVVIMYLNLSLKSKLLRIKLDCALDITLPWVSSVVALGLIGFLAHAPFIRLRGPRGP